MLTSQDLPSPAMRPPAESKRRGQLIPHVHVLKSPTYPSLPTVRCGVPLIKPSGSHSSIVHPSAAVHALQAKLRIPSYLPLAAGRQRDVDKAPGVQLALVGAALGGLGLLLGFDLHGGRFISISESADGIIVFGVGGRESGMRNCRAVPWGFAT